MDVTSTFILRPADFGDSQLISLLKHHHALCTAPESNVPGQPMFALDLNGLQAPNINLWTIWSSKSTANSDAEPNELLGCGALKIFQLNDGTVAGEIKSMHTRSTARGQGVGAATVAKLIEVAKELGADKVYLETGSLKAFEPARKLYEKQGFTVCGPYGDYKPQQNSIFMYKDVSFAGIENSK